MTLHPHAALTVEAVRAKGWEALRLAPRSKKPPPGRPWQVTKDPSKVAAWFEAGANVGLVCHERTGVAVLDPDKPQWVDMVETLGQPCRPWVITGSGNLHYYVQWEPDLPAKLTWQDEIIGEIQRGPGQQQVVLPGSVHPTGGTYRWITESLDPVYDPLPELPGVWRAYLHGQSYANRR